ncbi:MAG: PQQ-binding-like beta-propeller repeat protein, partial [Flavobacteriales bacterium]
MAKDWFETHIPNGTSSYAISKKILRDAQGNIYIGGELQEDLAVAKFDSLGNILWKYVIGGNLNNHQDDFSDFVIDQWGNAYLTGVIENATAPYRQAILIKLSSGGSLLWQKNIDKGFNSSLAAKNLGLSVLFDKNNDLILSASVSDSLNEHYGTVRKYTQNGTLLWSYEKKWFSYFSFPSGALAVDSLNNIYCVGTHRDTVGSFNTQMAILKLDQAGTQIFYKKINNSSDEDALVDVVLDSVASVYVIGIVKNSNYDAYIAKFDNNGSLQWSQIINQGGSDYPKRIRINKDGNIVVASNFFSVDKSSMMMYSPNGSQIWNKLDPISPSSFTSIWDFEFNENRNSIIAVGEYRPTSGALPDIMLVEYSFTGGNIIQTEIINGPGNTNDVGRDILKDQYGQLYVFGTQNIFATRTSWFLEKADSLMNPIWTTTVFPEPLSSSVYIQTDIDENGNMYLASTVPDTLGNKGISLVKFSHAGEIIWERRINMTTAPNPAAVSDLKVDKNGDIILVGRMFVAGGGLYDWAVIKYDKNGNFLWSQTHNGSGTASLTDLASTLDIDSIGNIVVMGYQSSPAGARWVVRKYSSTGVVLWTQDFTSAGNLFTSMSLDFVDINGNLVIDDSLNVYFTGGGSNGTTGGFTLGKLNAAGDVIWLKVMGDPFGYLFGQYGKTVKLDGVGNIYVSCVFPDSANIPSLISLVKYTAGGTMVWKKTKTSPGQDAAFDCEVVNPNRILVSGTMNYSGPSGSNGVYIGCFDSTGTIIWEKSLTTSHFLPFLGVDSTYAYVIRGDEYYPPNNEDIMFLNRINLVSTAVDSLQIINTNAFFNDDLSILNHNFVYFGGTYAIYTNPRTYAVRICSSDFSSTGIFGPDTLCAGTSVMNYYVHPDSSYTTNWSYNDANSFISILSDSSAAVNFGQSANSGLLTAVSSGTIGCKASVMPLVLLPSGNVFAGYDLTYCEGDSITLHALPSDSLQWSDGLSNDSAFYRPAGSYEFFVT